MSQWVLPVFLLSGLLLSCNQSSRTGGNEVGNGGTSSYLIVDHGLVHARHLIDRLKLVSVPERTRTAVSNEAVSWFFEHQTELKTALDSMKLEWRNTLPDFCPKDHVWACHQRGTQTVFVSRQDIPVLLTYRDAAYTLIHEAVHLIGEPNEERAKAAALIALTTWKTMGHPESPHWFDIAESPTTAERLQQDPLLTHHHYSDWDGTNLVVWDERLIQRYSVKKDEWSLVHVQNNGLSWKRSGMNLGSHRHQAMWIQENGLVIVPCAQVSRQLKDQAFGVRLDAKKLAWETISLDGAPSARSLPGLAKSDTQLFVWGGRECNSAPVSLNDGGIYDPASDSWTAIPSDLPNTPEPRYEHGMLWNGRALIVWGGYGIYKNPGSTGHAGVQANGGIYDPSTKTWTPITNQGDAPVGRLSPRLVASEQKLYVIGGSSQFNNSPERAIHAYDFATQTWAKLPDAPRGFRLNYFEAVHTFWTGSQVAVVTPSGAYFYSEADGAWSQSGRAAMPNYREGSRMYWTGLEGLLWDPEQRLGFALYP